MKRRIFSAAFAMLMACSLCIGSAVPVFAAGRVISITDTDGNGELSRREVIAALGENPTECKL